MYACERNPYVTIRSVICLCTRIRSLHEQIHLSIDNEDKTPYMLYKSFLTYGVPVPTGLHIPMCEVFIMFVKLKIN